MPACDARGHNRPCDHSYRTARRTARPRRARTDPVWADTTAVLSFHSIPPLSMLDGRPRRTIQHTMSGAGSSALNLHAELVSATRSARPRCRRRRLTWHWRGHVNVPNNAGYRSAREHYACTRRSGGVDVAFRRTHSRPTNDARSIAADSSGRRPSSRREASQKSDCRGRSGREIASDSTGQGFDRTGVHAGGRDSSVPCHGPEAIHAYGRPRLIQPGRRLDQALPGPYRQKLFRCTRALIVAARWLDRSVLMISLICQPDRSSGQRRIEVCGPCGCRLLAGESAGGREEETMSTNLLTSAASLTIAGDVRRRFMKPQQAGEGWVDGSGRSRPAR